ncbi:hypothetical protein DFJ74DRAFT_765327 [Hyaloraphidium curvatum]|nr:hypothetical protein DFJ74DRAFT_765327 [Hyaloraphidium curvatum]
MADAAVRRAEARLAAVRDTELPRLRRTRLAFEGGQVSGAQQNAAFKAAERALQDIKAQAESATGGGDDLADRRLMLAAEAASLLDVLAAKKEDDLAAAVAEESAPATPAAPRTSFLANLVAPLRGQSRVPPAAPSRPPPARPNTGPGAPLPPPPSASLPALDAQTSLAILASELDELDRRLRALPRLAFEVLDGGSLSPDLPRVPPNEPYFRLVADIAGAQARLQALVLDPGDRPLETRRDDLLFRAIGLDQRLDRERRSQHSAREGERQQAEIEELLVRDVQERSRAEEESRRAELRRRAEDERRRRDDEVRAQIEQQAKLEADRRRLDETRRRVEDVRVRVESTPLNGQAVGFQPGPGEPLDVYLPRPRPSGGGVVLPGLPPAGGPGAGYPIHRTTSDMEAYAHPGGGLRPPSPSSPGAPPLGSGYPVTRTASDFFPGPAPPPPTRRSATSDAALPPPSGDLAWTSDPVLPAGGASTFPRSTPPALNVTPALPESRDPYLEALEDQERRLAALVAAAKEEEARRAGEIAAREENIRRLEAELSARGRPGSGVPVPPQAVGALAARPGSVAPAPPPRPPSGAPRPGPPVPPREPPSPVSPVPSLGHPPAALGEPVEVAADAGGEGEQAVDEKAMLEEGLNEIAELGHRRARMPPDEQYLQAVSWIDRSNELQQASGRPSRDLYRLIEALRDAAFRWLADLVYNDRGPSIKAVRYLAEAYRKDNELKTVLALYNVGAERGQPECCEELARMYERGEGVRPDVLKAKEIRKWKGLGSPDFRKKAARRRAIFSRSCSECDDGMFCEFSFPDAPQGSVACVDYGDSEDFRSLYRRYAGPDKDPVAARFLHDPCVAVSAMPSPPSFTGTLITAGTGGTYATLSDAVAAASPGDRIQVLEGTIVEGAAVSVSKSLEIFGTGSGCIVRRDSLTSVITIAPGSGPVYIHDLQIANYQVASGDANGLSACITAATMQEATPDGSPGIYIAGCTFTYPKMGVSIDAASWVVRGCTFNPNSDTPGATIRALAPYGSTGESFAADNTFVAPSQASRLIGLALNAAGPRGASYTTGWKGKFVVSGNSITSAGAPRVYLDATGMFRQPGAVGNPGNGGEFSLYLVNNDFSVPYASSPCLFYAAAGALFSSEDVPEPFAGSSGVEPLSFFNLLYAKGNTFGSRTSGAEKGALFFTSSAAGTLGTPAGGLYAGNNAFAAPDTPLDSAYGDASFAPKLLTVELANFAPPSPLLTPVFPGPASGLPTADNVPLSAGDRVLAIDACDGTADMPAGSDAAGAVVPVSGGAEWAGTRWKCTSVPATVGTDALVFSEQA